MLGQWPGMSHLNARSFSLDQKVRLYAGKTKRIAITHYLQQGYEFGFSLTRGVPELAKLDCDKFRLGVHANK